MKDFKNISEKNIASRIEESKLDDLKKENNIRMTGYPHYIRPFNENKKQVFKEFEIRPEIISDVHGFLSMATNDYKKRQNLTAKENVTLVGVHNRRTDFVNWVKGHCDGKPISDKYFEVNCCLIGSYWQVKVCYFFSFLKPHYYYK